MDEADLRKLLDAVASGEVLADDAVARLRRLPYSDLGFARVDHHRDLRQGLPEAIYGPGKTAAQVAAIADDLLSGPGTSPVVLTRATDDQISAALERRPGGVRAGATVVWRRAERLGREVAVVTAGTADLPVADECGAVLDAHGVDVVRLTDVGVAGLHRLLASMDELLRVEAVVVVAGMEGALPSVVGGLTGAPVVAVPTSTGYGAALDGVTALLGMLASCAAGLSVVGIDNGFGAACAVLRMFVSPAGADGGGTPT